MNKKLLLIFCLATTSLWSMEEYKQNNEELSDTASFHSSDHYSDSDEGDHFGALPFIQPGHLVINHRVAIDNVENYISMLKALNPTRTHSFEIHGAFVYNNKRPIMLYDIIVTYDMPFRREISYKTSFERIYSIYRVITNNYNTNDIDETPALIKQITSDLTSALKKYKPTTHN